jgi:hypothetical protein
MLARPTAVAEEEVRHAQRRKFAVHKRDGTEAGNQDGRGANSTSAEAHSRAVMSSQTDAFSTNRTFRVFTALRTNRRGVKTNCEASERLRSSSHYQVHSEGRKRPGKQCTAVR